MNYMKNKKKLETIESRSDSSISNEYRRRSHGSSNYYISAEKSNEKQGKNILK